MTSPAVRLCLVFHNHQPIGNFDSVFEQAYQDSYLPFLDVFEPYEDLKISLHTSGCLMEWMDVKHPEYLDRIAKLVIDGRVEVIGGAFFEPILAMLPSRDRVGQISKFSDWLKNRLNATVRGMWIPERVWESSMTSDIATAGIEYTVLDDFHFRCAGLTNQKLNGYYVTEDNGQLIKVFPGSEQLRYLIPFREPHESIDMLRGLAERAPGSIAVFGDDGEKFGTWPDTKEHVYTNGWLKRFFDALNENRDWLSTTTLADAVDHVPANGKVYLPDASYREMTEWSLPVERQLAYEKLVHELDDDSRFDASRTELKSFIRGGFWRNFKTKYEETNEMYARMIYISRLLESQEPGAAEPGAAEPGALARARQHLYRGQCNCPYWHGAFGGLYLPHLRHAIYSELIAAENILETNSGREETWVEATVSDYNFDARKEIRLANDSLVAWFAPSVGGQMYELDIRTIRQNLLSTVRRRPEAYHERVKQGEKQGDDQAASIHDRVVFKQAGLDQRLVYDRHPRKSLIDHFWDEQAGLDDVSGGHAEERGDFSTGIYTSKIRRNSGRVQVQMSRDGNAWGVPLKLTKGITLNSGSDVLEIAYLIEGLPEDREFHFGVEFNVSGLPAGADDRFFHDGSESSLGQLQSRLDLKQLNQLHMRDQWLGIDVSIESEQAMDLWTFPIETVSQSEGGFELVHQSVVFQPHWLIRGDADGKWLTVMRLSMDTSIAKSRMQNDHKLMTV